MIKVEAVNGTHYESARRKSPTSLGALFDSLGPSQKTVYMQTKAWKLKITIGKQAFFSHAVYSSKASATNAAAVLRKKLNAAESDQAQT